MDISRCYCPQVDGNVPVNHNPFKAFVKTSISIICKNTESLCCNYAVHLRLYPGRTLCGLPRTGLPLPMGGPSPHRAVAEKPASVHRCRIETGRQSSGRKERSIFITLPGNGLLPQKTMCPNPGGFDEEFYDNTS